MKLYTIDTGFFKLDGGAMFGIVPKGIWNKLNPADDKNLCTWAMRCLLIETDNQLILIDTGMGSKQSEKFFSYYEPHGEDSLEKSLNKNGFSKNDITDVILTHLHFDHCGGAVEIDASGKLAPVFKNATYWSHQSHWQWALEPNARERASFLKENIVPIQESGQLKFLEKGMEIFPGFDYFLSNGHTEAMIIPVIKFREQTLAYMADLIPSRWHIPQPYIMGYDVRPLVTLSEKISFLDQAEKEGYFLFFEHDPSLECCNLKKTERGTAMDKGFRLQEII